MPYTVFADFAGGLDARKTPETTQPGALIQLDNAFVNAGGEIEKRKTFTAVATLPANTFGLSFKDNKAYVFGTAAAPSMPAYTAYEQLVPSSGTPGITRIKDVSRFADQNYVVADMDDATVRHFFNGAEITALRDNGNNVVPHNTKMYIADGKDLRFSAINDPTDLAGTGSGIIDITAQDVGSTEVIGIEQYYNQLGLFEIGRASCRERV